MQKSVVATRRPKLNLNHVVYDFSSPTFDVFGTSYEYEEEASSSTNYVVHAASFIRLASECGLALCSFQNCEEFHEEHKYTYGGDLPFPAIKLEPQQRKIIGFQTTFVFRKT